MDSYKVPLQVGVTGGIGSGKSVVCKLFDCLGVPVYDADTRAKWLTTNDAKVREKIIELMGEKAYLENGAYNRSFVASEVFDNPALLSKLNAIIHPAVLIDTEEWVQNHPGQPYVIKEAAIMNKAGHGNSLDFVVVVDAPIALRIERILKRDGRSEEEIKAIIARQISDSEREKIADFTIVNDGISALIPQVLALHERLILASSGD